MRLKPGLRFDFLDVIDYAVPITLVAALIYALLFMPGCATVGTKPGQAPATEAARLAEMNTIASHGVAITDLVKAAQESEIRFYRSQTIPITPAAHEKVQVAFKKFAVVARPAVQRLDNLSTPEADRRAAANELFDAAKDLLSTFDQSGTVVAPWAEALRAILKAAGVL